MEPKDLVLLTGRDADRVEVAANEVKGGSAVARVEGRVVECPRPDAIASLAAELGTVDIVFSNATSRMTPKDDPTDEVDAVTETSNLATTGILRAFAPRLRTGGRLIIVASALGTLDKLDQRIAGRFAEVAEQDLDAVDALVATGVKPFTMAAQKPTVTGTGRTSHRRSRRSPRCERSPTSVATDPPRTD